VTDVRRVERAPEQPEAPDHRASAGTGRAENASTAASVEARLL
jgi:hypothetical protein